MTFLIKTLGFKESLRVEVRSPSTNDKLITVIEGKIEEFNRSYRY